MKGHPDLKNGEAWEGCSAGKLACHQVDIQV